MSVWIQSGPLHEKLEALAMATDITMFVCLKLRIAAKAAVVGRVQSGIWSQVKWLMISTSSLTLVHSAKINWEPLKKMLRKTEAMVGMGEGALADLHGAGCTEQLGNLLSSLAALELHSVPLNCMNCMSNSAGV